MGAVKVHQAEYTMNDEWLQLNLEKLQLPH